MHVLLVVYGLVAIVFSFLCSVAEAVLLSVTPSYIAALGEEKKRLAARLERLKDNIDRPLAAILSLNTIAHTAGAAGVGAAAADIWGSPAVGIASAVMTLLILILSEIIPKTIGAVYWRQLASWVAGFVELLVWILYPLVLLAERVTLLTGGGKRLDVVTREEVAAMATLSAEDGELEIKESRILRNLLRLKSLTVQDIMTPRTVIVTFSHDTTVGQVLEQDSKLTVSRIPVYDDTIDNVTGFVLKTDILLAQADDRPDTQLKDLRRDITPICATALLSELFDVLMHGREHIALVVDEFGGTDGLVTLEDLIETLLGMEIVDEADGAVDMQRLAREKWQRRAKSLGLELDEPGDGTGEHPPGQAEERRESADDT